TYHYSRPCEILRCPWHGWEFDVRTGKSWCDPARLRLMAYAVSVEPGASLAAGPYVAETYPVALEDDYVIVETRRMRGLRPAFCLMRLPQRMLRRLGIKADGNGARNILRHAVVARLGQAKVAGLGPPGLPQRAPEDLERLVAANPHDVLLGG